MTELIPRGARELVTPPEEEARKLERVVEKVRERISSASSKFPEVRSILLGGSFARGTWLPGEADIDFFVRVSPDVDEARFEEVGLKLGFEATKGYPRGKKFSQHPYTEARVDGVTINIVPCFDVPARQWKSAADRSPYHVELIKASLSDAQKHDVRLLKKLMKGVGVYGAEIEKEGFSGYACEVLVLKHGSFRNVLEHFVHLRASGNGKLMSLPDPVDETRDLAKAISDENVARFVLAARSYVKRPSLEFFEGLSGTKHSGLRLHLIGITFSHRKLTEDILWGELKRTMRHLSKHIEGAGFKVARTAIASDDSTTSAFLFLPEVTRLPRLERRVGPSVSMEKESGEFVAKKSRRSRLLWAGVDGRLQVLEDRQDVELVRFLKEMVREAAKRVGGSPEITKAIAKNGQVIEGRALLRVAKGKSWLSAGLDAIVSDTLGTSPG